MSGVIMGAMAVAAVASAGIAYSNGRQQAKAAKRASIQQQQQARQQADAAAKAQRQQEMEFNRANRKAPNAGAMLSSAQQAGAQGLSGTMLTGVQGVGQDQLQLGKQSLLGSNNTLGG
ncbi:hypothetical protein [Basilea psittacipulmonis]|uniref:Uncharacterized protein n=1 Tax=Basilea psittacipulmonis DSM 24701 TaxID=1072685 RepID=A0A077DHT0_9BURK|nr:hypothetical protein [Basilea psittacipulmonis]AIL33102.1 hypothetical protein IX83_07105 [Basilea psittacipulmonis DSM 24701]